jgi:hypothetical protein
MMLVEPRHVRERPLSAPRPVATSSSPKFTAERATGLASPRTRFACRSYRIRSGTPPVLPLAPPTTGPHRSFGNGSPCASDNPEALCLLVPPVDGVGRETQQRRNLISGEGALWLSAGRLPGLRHSAGASSVWAVRTGAGPRVAIAPSSTYRSSRLYPASDGGTFPAPSAVRRICGSCL